MTDLDLTLARALVAVPGFRVMDGSLWVSPNDLARRVVDGDCDFAWAFVRDGEVVREFAEVHARTVWTNYGPWLPDYRDPATAGCLAELLDTGHTIATADGGGWVVWLALVGAEDHYYYGATRGEAIARAIVAAGRCAV